MLKRSRHVLLGLLLVVAVVPGAALADGEASPEETSADLAGGPTRDSALQIKAESPYEGVVSSRAEQHWYRFEGDGGKEIVISVTGKTRSCPVRVSLLDAGGRTLAQLISVAGGNLPFVAPIVDPETSGAYYLRIDSEPYSACVGGGYAFTLLHPRQLEPCLPAGHDSIGHPRLVACGFMPDPVFLPACISSGRALREATVAVAKERRLVARKKASKRALKKLESRRNALLREASAACF